MSDDQRPAALPTDHSSVAESEADIERREVLKRLGVLAALTPPAVVTMLLTPRASAAS